MKNFFIFFILSSYLIANEVKNIDDIENIDFNIKTTEVTEIFKDIAKDLVEIKKKQFNILKRLDDVQEKVYHNEQKLGLVELIIDEQKSIIKDIILEINSVKNSENIQKTEVIEEKKNKNTDKLETFKATTFELLEDSEIYDSFDGNVIQNWVKGNKFTAYQKRGSWIQISGYFSRGKWKKSKEELWINVAQYSVKNIKK